MPSKTLNKNKIRTEKIDYNLTERHFKDDLLDVLLAAIQPEFQEAYFGCDKRLDFFRMAEEPLARYKFIENKTASRERRDAMIKAINGQLPTLIEQLEDEETAIESLIENEGLIEVKALLKWIALFVDEVYSTLKANKPEDIEDWMDDIISDGDDLLSFLGLLYLKVHISSYSLSRTKAYWLSRRVDSYMRRYLACQIMASTGAELENLKNENAALTKDAAKKEKAIESKKNEIAKLNDKLKELSQRLQQRDNSTKAREIEKLHIEIESEKNRNLELGNEIERLLQALKEQESRSVSKLEFEKVSKQLVQSRSDCGQLRQENSRLLESRADWLEYNLVTELESYLAAKGATKEVMKVLEPYIRAHTKPSEHETDIRVEGELILGYCKIDEQGHSFVDAKGSTRQLLQIPEDKYIGEGQFLVADGSGRFIESLSCQFTAGKAAGALSSFAVAKDGGRLELKNVSALKSGRVVGLNSRDEIIESYRPIKFNADNFLKSALVRGQKMYAVERCLENGVLCLDISDGAAALLPVCHGGKVAQHSLIFVKGDRIVKSIEHLRFYTSSSLYLKSEFGSVTVESGRILFKCNSGERRIVNQIPSRVEINDGDVIVVDEFFNFIEKKNEQDIQVKVAEKGVSGGKAKASREEASEEDEDSQPFELHPEKVLIIGDEGLAQSYKLSLYKSGFVSDVVSGVDSWHKISKAVHQCDIVVFVTDHASHANYYKYKYEFSDKTTFYAPFEGPNRIVDLLNDAFCAAI